MMSLVTQRTPKQNKTKQDKTKTKIVQLTYNHYGGQDDATTIPFKWG